MQLLFFGSRPSLSLQHDLSYSTQPAFQFWSRRSTPFFDEQFAEDLFQRYWPKLTAKAIFRTQ